MTQVLSKVRYVESVLHVYQKNVGFFLTLSLLGRKDAPYSRRISVSAGYCVSTTRGADGRSPGCVEVCGDGATQHTSRRRCVKGIPVLTGSAGQNRAY